MNARNHAPRPYAMHDNRELRRHERGERAAFYVFCFVCGVVLVALCEWAGAL